jgi:phospholipase/carboxylesterase
MLAISRVRSRSLAAVFAAAVVAGACDPAPSERDDDDNTIQPNNGRLTARVVAPTKTVEPGLSVETVTPSGRPFGLYVPSTYDPSRNWPITVLLHGSGGSGEGMALDFQEYAEASGLVLLTPNSYSVTWDLIAFNEFSVDRAYIDNMLKWAFDRIAVDPARVSISGFSDGATYALWLGLKNGDLFGRIAAFTPCSNVPQTRTGNPEVFISHGTDDQVNEIDECSRITVPRLLEAGYVVQFVEYPSPEGNGHFVTPEVLTQGMTFLARETPPAALRR